MAGEQEYRFREGTVDRDVWRSVFDLNEYELPSRLEGAVVLDVGMNIGAFASACRVRGAAEVFGVELCADNLSLAIHNFHQTPGGAILQPYHAACWRCDLRGARACFGGHDGRNTAGSWAVPFTDARTEVPTIPFDDLVKTATDFGRRRLDVCKLDCEGSEWMILYTTRLLNLVDQIVGEYHCGVFPYLHPAARVEGMEYSLDGMEAILREAGFVVHTQRPAEPDYALFWAFRPRVSPWMRLGKWGN